MHIFVDESKSKGYLIIAVIIAPGLLKSTRRKMLELRMPGQGHIHFVNERDSRRKLILSEISKIEMRVRAYKAIGYSQAAGRDACIELMLDDIRSTEATSIVFEKDESSEKSDRMLLHRGLLARGLSKNIEYRFMSKSAEPIIWIADAIAWSYSRGGDFKRRAQLLVEKEISVGL